MAAETHTSLLAFFGRLADQLTRRVLRPQETSVSLQEESPPPLGKDDGHFAFYDLEPSAAAYHVQIGGPSYLTRTLAVTLPTTTPVQVAFPGEDELYVALSGPPNAQNQVTFEPVDFVPAIEAGASVIGPGAFTTTLAEPLGGRNVGLAELTSAAGLVAGQVLRIVRSSTLLVRPGPYYPFPGDVTVVAVHVVENDPAEPSIGGATLTIGQIDGAGPTVVTIGGLPLNRFALGGSATAFVVLDDDDRVTTTNDRGDAVFFFAGSTSLASVTITVAKAQYVSATATINVTTKARNFQKVSLTRI